MPRVNTSPEAPRTPATSGLQRGQLAAGDVFSKILNGNASDTLYGALGSNGNMWSFNVQTGNLARSSRPEGPVVRKGKFAVAVNITKDGQEVARRDVPDNAVFRVKGENNQTVYCNLGGTSDGRFMSLNAGKPLSGDYSVTNRGDKRVIICGTFAFDVTMDR